MSLHVGIAGVFKRILEMHVGASGSWKLVTDGWVASSGVWKRFWPPIPANMIALFAAAAPSPWSALSYSGLYPFGANAEGASDLYSNTHEHSTSVTNVFGNCNTVIADDAAFRQPMMAVHGSAHNFNHTHGSTNHEPEFQSWRGAVAGGALSIPTSAILFFNGASIPTGWARATFTSGRYVKLDSAGTGATGGAATHTHSHGSSTSTNPLVDYQIGTTWAVCVNASHNHTTPDHPGEANDPTFIELDMVSPSGSPALGIPSGIVALFIGSVVPLGWSYYSAAEGKFIKAVNGGVGATGGGPDHGHSIATTSGSYTATADTGAADGYSSCSQVHNHWVTHTHATGSNLSMPLARQLLICRKD